MASGTGEKRAYLRHGWVHTDPWNSDNLDGDGGGRAGVCVRVRARKCVRVRACIHACVRDVFTIYDNII